MAKLQVQSPFLLTSRSFSPDENLLYIELSKAYVDIGLCVNNRTIGIYAQNTSYINGETWFTDNSRLQKVIRSTYIITTDPLVPPPVPPASIEHNLPFDVITRFTRCQGQFTDGTNWYGLISGSNVAIAGQISFYIDPVNIVFLSGAGAPVLTSGNIVLEWLSNV